MNKLRGVACVRYSFGFYRGTVLVPCSPGTIDKTIIAKAKKMLQKRAPSPLPFDNGLFVVDFINQIDKSF